MIDKVLNCDKELFLALNFDGGSFLDNIMWMLSSIMSYIIMVIVFLFLARKLRQLSYKNIAILFLFLAFIVLLADQSSGFFKDYMPKLRPSRNPELAGLTHTVRGYIGGMYGTVSAHAANGFGLAVFMCFVLRNKTFTYCVITYVALISYSRIYLSVHYPLDIFFGMLMGVFYGFAVYKLYMWFSTKYIPQNKVN